MPDSPEETKIDQEQSTSRVSIMEFVTEDDFFVAQDIARRYCRVVDATRSRKRMDGAATVVREGRAPYGTDDVSDDVTQDALIMFGRRLRKITETCDASAVCVATRAVESWQYERRDGETIIVDRKRIMYWAVRDAAARNGYRVDVEPDPRDTTPGGQLPRGMAHADIYPSIYLASQSEVVFAMAWGQGADFPALATVIRHANDADDLGRHATLGKAAQELYGGPLNSSSKVQKLRDVVRAEWSELKDRLDGVRDDVAYRHARAGGGAD